ncbi:MAG: V-type ATP synthase subunit K [Spirochaetales bacterium]|nr:V-type ATP synthase subunit K [Spirochaetales bacterium]
MDIGYIGSIASVTLAAIGSAFGIGVAGMSAVGAWKKTYVENKPAPFLLVFIGAPLTQTIYGFILLIILNGSEAAGPLAKMFIGLLGGAAMGFSAYFQGKVGANAADALAASKEGTGNYIIAIGLVESVALFVMVFLLITATGAFGPML